MRLVLILGVMGWGTSTALSDRVHWTAKATVTEVTGAGLQALVAADELVEVEFSYDDMGVGVARSGFVPFYQTFDFRENIELEMEVTIGGQSWSGSVSSGVSGTPLTFEITDVEQLFGTFERVSPALSSRFGEVFSSFPGASATAANEVQLIFEDGVSSFDAVFGLAFLPVESPPALASISSVLFSPCDFTFGSGEIRAGTEKVAFVIDLATLTIGDGAPGPAPTAIDVSIAWVAGQVVLSWGAAVDKCYRIQRSSDLQFWSNLIGIVAGSESEMYSFSPVGAPDAQYYRVIQVD